MESLRRAAHQALDCMMTHRLEIRGALEEVRLGQGARGLSEVKEGHLLQLELLAAAWPSSGIANAPAPCSCAHIGAQRVARGVARGRGCCCA